MIPTHARSGTPNAGRYRIGDIVVDLRSRCVVRPDGATELTPRVFDLLLTLVAEPQAVHSRDALFARVWGTSCLEDSNLTQSVFVIRKALGDARKHWVRTLPKIGYRFEPPGSVVFEPEPPPEAASSRIVDTDIGADRLPMPMSPPRTTPIGPRWSRLAVGVLAAVLLGVPGAGVVPAMQNPETVVQPQPHAATIGVVLVDAAPATASEEERRATALLHEWVRWKLALLPSVVLVEEEDLIADRDAPTFVVDLAVADARGVFTATCRVRPFSRSPGDAMNGDRDLAKLVESAAQPLSAIDRVSQGLLRALLPARAADRWPALALDRDSAARFARAMALLRHDPPAAIAPLRMVIGAAPEFGPARIGLARALAETGDLTGAGEHAAQARRLSAPLPADASAVLAAEADTLTSIRAQAAADAYARLSASHPERAAFLLGEARALLRANRPERAMHRLAELEWERQPLDLRIRERVVRAETAFVLGYHDQARELASEAIGMIADGDDGRKRELGQAQLLLARARNQQNHAIPQPALYTTAADTFQRHGYATDAAIALFFRAAAADDLADGERRFAPLMATLEARGDHRNALRVLRSMAEQYAYAGRRDDARRMRLRALRVADHIGDEPMMQLLDLDLLGEDLQAGNLDLAERRLDRLRDNALWTKYRFRVARMENLLLRYRGRQHEALAALDRKLFDAERGERLDVAPGEAAKIACARMETLLALGELRLARAQLRGCRDSGSPSVPIFARIGEARIAYHAGDVAAARRLADDAARRSASHPRDCAYVDIGTALASLFTRLRDHDRADALYRDALAIARRENYPLQLAEIDTGRAELAAARGDWADAARYSAAARARFEQRVWLFDSRLQLLEIARMRADGDTASARARARALAGRAGALGDAVIGAQAAALAGSALRTHDGLPADTHAIDWLDPIDARIAFR